MFIFISCTISILCCTIFGKRCGANRTSCQGFVEILAKNVQSKRGDVSWRNRRNNGCFGAITICSRARAIVQADSKMRQQSSFSGC
uniref:Putative secreted protein n=1 Tax=Xenopsylla cheopis TaxID=163159 RepID=A0A6M2DWT1_XENCH